jgi:phosphate-selective porin OprO/OprP
MSPRALRSILASLLITAGAAAPARADEGKPAADEANPIAFAVAGPKGFGFRSADDRFRLFVHGLIQADFSTFLGEKPQPVRDTFALRAAGLQLDAALGSVFRGQIFANLAGSTPLVTDAWIEAEIAPWLRLRAGKFPYPISEERLTPAIALPFVGTSFATTLLPARDVGVMIHGDLGRGLLRYNLALGNGATSGAPADLDADSEKDVVARVFARPFQSTSIAPLRRLGIGVGASYGVHTGNTASPQLPVLRTYGGQVYFQYRNDMTPTGTAIANGPVTRFVPHLVWSFGPVGAYADVVVARERVDATSVTTLGWSVIPSVALTGEDASPLGFILPKRPFDLSKGHVGTVLVVGGVGSIHVSSSAFSGAADPGVAMERATVYGAGLNWYPYSGIAALASFGHTRFSAWGRAAARAPENTLIVRLQMVL